MFLPWSLHSATDSRGGGGGYNGSQGLQELETLFWQVSDPKHPQFGHHLSSAEVAGLVSPPPVAFQRVEDHLSGCGLAPDHWDRGMDFISVRATASQVQCIFKSRFSFVFLSFLCSHFWY